MQPKRKTLRVGNISDETSLKELRNFFSKYGPVFDVQIRSAHPNRVRAWLVMSRDGAEDAIVHMHGEDLLGRRLTVEDADLCCDDE
jgi:RNA recognition motif-containing protein